MFPLVSLIGRCGLQLYPGFLQNNADSWLAACMSWAVATQQFAYIHETIVLDAFGSTEIPPPLRALCTSYFEVNTYHELAASGIKTVLRRNSPPA